jgi:hypothetical protein
MDLAIKLKTMFKLFKSKKPSKVDECINNFVKTVDEHQNNFLNYLQNDITQQSFKKTRS